MLHSTHTVHVATIGHLDSPSQTNGIVYKQESRELAQGSWKRCGRGNKHCTLLPWQTQH